MQKSLILALSLGLTTGLLPADVPPLAWWRFEGEPGTAFIADEDDGVQARAEVLPDAAGQREVVYGGPAPSPYGGKSSLEFKNEGSSDLNGAFVHADLAKLVAGLEELTMEAWIRPQEIGQAAILRMSRHQPQSGSVLIEINREGSLSCKIYKDEQVLSAVSPSLIEAGKWSHVAAVFHHSTLTIYINGELAGERTNPGIASIPTNMGPLGIGAYVRTKAADNAGQFFVGEIDEVRVTPKALSPAEFLCAAGGSR